MERLAILYEHPLWHQPLFDALKRQDVDFLKVDLTCGAFQTKDIPEADVIYNLVSPSAYIRSNLQAIPYAFALCSFMEYDGKTVLNGTSSMKIEMSKSRQIALTKKLNINFPQSIIFNQLEALDNLRLDFPLILKPEQGGSGARMYLLNSRQEIEETFQTVQNLWQPDNLMLLQEKLNYDEEIGCIRIEYVNGKMIYAMRIVSNGTFNLCPSIVCNPDDGEGICEIPTKQSKPPSFFAMKEIKQEWIDIGMKIMNEAGHFSGSIELIECTDGRVVVYDINSNSNLRESIGLEFGNNPFDFVANELISLIKN